MVRLAVAVATLLIAAGVGRADTVADSAWTCPANWDAELCAAVRGPRIDHQANAAAHAEIVREMERGRQLYLDELRTSIDADRRREDAERAAQAQRDQQRRDMQAAESERHFNASQRDMHRDFMQSMELSRQADELRRIGNELEDLNALERQRDMTRPRF